MSIISSKFKTRDSDDPHKRLVEIEAKLRFIGLIYHPNVKKLLKNAYRCKNPRIFDAILFRLELTLKNHGLLSMRVPDEFRPYCPEFFSKQGLLYLLDQYDGLPIFVDHHALVTGLGILGTQGAGKSRFIRHLCDAILKIDPQIRITIIDPKNGFSDLPGFIRLDLADLSFNMRPPANVKTKSFVLELVPILSNTCGLIYALALLEQSAELALQRQNSYCNATGNNTEICLEDIREALLSIKVSGFRQQGYKDAAVTALSLVLGKRKLFSCRAGVDLEWLFSQNMVLNATTLTDDLQCRFLVTFLLFWLFQKYRGGTQTNKLWHIIIVDDASRFVGINVTQFDGPGRTSPLGHLLAILRSSGVCFCFATQLPAQIEPAVLSLTRNLITTGNISGQEHLRVIKNAMSLNEEQKNAIARFQAREALVFFPNSKWPHPLHGWTPDVVLPSTSVVTPSYPVSIQSWHSLTMIPQPSSVPAAVKPIPASSVTPPSVQSVLSADAEKLIYECVCNPFENVREHIKRLNFSVRVYEAAKNDALQNGFLIASACGKSVYLIPTAKSYTHFNMSAPYKRAASIEHAYYVRLAEYHLRRLPGFKVQIETPIGQKGATIDLTTTYLNGVLYAFEITLNLSNLLSNAAKLQGTAYAKIYWLCRDEKTANAVRAVFNKSTALPADLINKFVYISVNKWINALHKGKP